jgi:hypothetical protein
LKRPRTAAECTDAPDILRLTTKQTGGITQMTHNARLNVKLFLRASLVTIYDRTGVTAEGRCDTGSRGVRRGIAGVQRLEVLKINGLLPGQKG